MKQVFVLKGLTSRLCNYSTLVITHSVSRLFDNAALASSLIYIRDTSIGAVQWCTRMSFYL
jgi:hypothetical protein